MIYSCDGEMPELKTHEWYLETASELETYRTDVSPEQVHFHGVKGTSPLTKLPYAFDIIYTRFIN
jgi:hypothetical protein